MWPSGIAQDQPIRSVAAPDSDQTGGIIFAFAIAIALVARERTGEPQRVETSLYGKPDLGSGTGHQHGRERRRPRGATLRRAAHRQHVHAASPRRRRDPALRGLITDRWEAMCRALEREDLLRDPRFASVNARNANLHELRAEVAGTLATRPAADWPPRFDQVEVPSSLIQDYAMIAVDPQAAANEYIVAVEDERYGRLMTVGSPVRVNGLQGEVRGLAPELGADTDATLRTLEYTPELSSDSNETGLLGSARTSQPGRPVHTMARSWGCLSASDRTCVSGSVANTADEGSAIRGWGCPGDRAARGHEDSGRPDRCRLPCGQRDLRRGHLIQPRLIHPAHHGRVGPTPDLSRRGVACALVCPVHGGHGVVEQESESQSGPSLLEMARTVGVRGSQLVLASAR